MATEPADRPRQLLKVEEAAEQLAIGRTLMFALLKSGAIRSVRVGRLRRIPVDAITEYIQRISSTGHNAPAA